MKAVPSQRKEFAIAVSPKNISSWQTLLNAAKIRQHVGILELAEGVKDDEIPPVLYHRKCHSYFTMKRSLNSIQSQQSDNEIELSSNDSRRSIRGKPSSLSVYSSEECIICGRRTKYKSESGTRENLVRCQEFCADETLRRAALVKMDEKMLAILSTDLIASEGHYHSTCYKAYTWKVAKSNKIVENGESKGTDMEEAHCVEEDAYCNAERLAHEELYTYIRNDIIPKPQIVEMTYLVSRIESSLTSLGIDSVRKSTRKHIRRKLEAEFGESLHIVSNTNGRLLLYPDSMSKNELVKHAYGLQEKLKKLHHQMLQKISLKQKK
ncbi:uncharacterized protein LOC135207801 isoform X3 [Macrobrachium nipponense]|uniref:uncharacterized protein LOC135207801 isoform X3 n=1 Tax=Macrobrachium nipponense TaxID=159736 RepID=UPI0030C8411F